MKYLFKRFLMVSFLLVQSTNNYCSQERVINGNRTIIAQSSDNEDVVFNEPFISYCQWIEEQLTTNPEVGHSRDTPLPIPATRDQILRIIKLLDESLCNEPMVFAINYLTPLKLDGLAEIIRICHTLTITPLLEPAIYEFVRLITRDKNLIEFATNPAFIESFNFSEEILQKLNGVLLLTEHETSNIRSLLHQDLPGMLPINDLSLSVSNNYLLASGNSSENESFIDVWNLNSTQNISTLHCEELVNKCSWFSSPEILLQTDSGVRLESFFSDMYHSKNTNIITASPKESIWASCYKSGLFLYRCRNW